jgi:hypothetical protein
VCPLASQVTCAANAKRRLDSATVLRMLAGRPAAARLRRWLKSGEDIGMWLPSSPRRSFSAGATESSEAGVHHPDEWSPN